ncbi:RnfH family protein [Vibrio sp. WXL103]|uniref:RnfH family protein n=1 Tax=Vibrio sp. WXL103 TaxID=3450710 RepID=UPI003EC8EEC7
MKASVIYANESDQMWLEVDLASDATILSAITQSGMVSLFPEIDLNLQKVGVFGKIKPLDTPLSEGDRVEIYRPITFTDNELSESEQL